MWLRRMLFGRTWSLLDVIVMLNVFRFGLWTGLLIWSLWILLIGPVVTKFFLTTDSDNIDPDGCPPPSNNGKVGKNNDGK